MRPKLLLGGSLLGDDLGDLIGLGGVLLHAYERGGSGMAKQVVPSVLLLVPLQQRGIEGEAIGKLRANFLGEEVDVFPINRADPVAHLAPQSRFRLQRGA